MYLKNTSNTVTVIINTARGRVSIKPHEIVDIKYKILPPISRSIVQSTEEEYLAFFEEKKGLISTITKMKEEDLVRDDVKIAPETEEKLEDLDKVDENEDEGTTNTDAPERVSFVSTLNSQKPHIDTKEEKREKAETDADTETEVNVADVADVKVEATVENEALLVSETNSDDEAAVLNQQIEELRKTWVATTAVRKKEQLSKKIKELQKQLKKISSKK